jgi:hypothetical protein
MDKALNNAEAEKLAQETAAAVKETMRADRAYKDKYDQLIVLKRKLSLRDPNDKEDLQRFGDRVKELSSN